MSQVNGRVWVVIVVIIIILAGAMFIWLHGPTSTVSSTQATVSPVAQVGTGTIDQGKQLTDDPNEPIAFSTGNLPVKITQTASSPVKDGQYLLANVKQCGPSERPMKYFSDLVTKLDKLPKTVYTVTNISSHYYISVIPSLLGYKDLDSVQADFFICPGDTGKLKAIQANEKWMVFIQNCDEGDTQCEVMAQTINPTIKIK